MPFLAPIAAVAGAVGSVASVAGGVVSGMAQKKAADYNAQIAANNATIAQRNATLAMEEGESNAQQQGLKTAQQEGKAKAIFGASGIDPLTGSAADTESAIDAAGLTDKQNTISGAARQAWGYQTQSSNFTDQSKLDKMQGEDEMAGSFLSGASSGLNSWLKFGNSGNLASGTT